MARFEPVISLSGIEGQGVRADTTAITGSSELSDLGISVAAAGDVNGDGRPDLLVGAPRAVVGDTDVEVVGSGAAYLIFGPAGGFGPSFNVNTLNGFNGVRLSGNELFPDADVGTSVAGVGDVNGDGFDDVLVGAESFQSDLDFALGDVFLVFGRRQFSDTLDLFALQQGDGLRFGGFDAFQIGEFARTGRSVAGGGDVNGDGLDDFAIGAPRAEIDTGSGSRPADVGVTYVVFGRQDAQTLAPAQRLDALDGGNGFRILGEGLGNDSTGWSVDIGGDLNNDGFADIVVGGPYASLSGRAEVGTAYVVFGTDRGFPAVVDLRGLDGTNGFQLAGRVIEGERLGRSVAFAGDINGDGIDDLLLGAPSDIEGGGGGTDNGTVYVVFGTDRGFGERLELPDLDGRNGFAMTVGTAADEIGFSVAPAGDVDGDGLADILIGAPRTDLTNAPDAGAAFIVFGSDLAFPDRAPLFRLDGTSGFRVNGVPLTLAGKSVAGLGDLDGDGLGEILIGAPANDAEEGTARDTVGVVGRAYIVSPVARLDDPVALIGDTLSEMLTGGSGADRLLGNAGNDVLQGLGNADRIDGGPGSDWVFYTISDSAVQVRLWDDAAETGGDAAGDILERIENLRGSAFNDLLSGSRADNVLEGLAGNDTLIGREGDDILRGAAGDDDLRGDEGNDVAAGGPGNDLIAGGDGDDALRGNSQNDRLDGGNGNDRVYGNIGGDILHGGTGDDALFGLTGNDRLFGGAGADEVFGGFGGDVLQGGAGDDTLAGQGGGDVFQFTPNGGTDTVRDFDAGTDRLDLHLLFDEIGYAGTTPLADGIVRAVTDGADTLIQVARGGIGTVARLSDIAPSAVTDAAIVTTDDFFFG